MQSRNIDLWGAANLRDFCTPKDANGRRFPYAVTWALPVNPQIMVSIYSGPNQVYADEYTRLNQRINQLGKMLVKEIQDRGFQASALSASERTDKVHIKGDFPHKTAATRAGLGWIGRHCQLVTRKYGSWVRLGTVFTDMLLSFGEPVNRHYCGGCRLCVEACPANALTGSSWHPGMDRDEILIVEACDRWKKEHFFEYHHGHNCGICSSVCPYGLRILKS
jgi:epoxyqueuosine reductase QueG